MMFRMIFLAVFITYVYYQTPWGKEDLAQVKAETIAKNEVREKAIKTCTQYGVAYFKEIGSFPFLKSTGEDATLTAEARCERTYNPEFGESTAFSKPEPFCIDLKKRERVRGFASPELLQALEVEWKKQDGKYPMCKA